MFSLGNTYTPEGSFPTIGREGRVPGTLWQINNRAAVSYVTGSHAFKAGVTTFWGQRFHAGEAPPVSYELRRGIPVRPQASGHLQRSAGVR